MFSCCWGGSPQKTRAPTWARSLLRPFRREGTTSSGCPPTPRFGDKPTVTSGFCGGVHAEANSILPDTGNSKSVCVLVCVPVVVLCLPVVVRLYSGNHLVSSFPIFGTSNLMGSSMCQPQVARTNRGCFFEPDFPLSSFSVSEPSPNKKTVRGRAPSWTYRAQVRFTDPVPDPSKCHASRSFPRRAWAHEARQRGVSKKIGGPPNSRSVFFCFCLFVFVVFLSFFNNK